MGRVARPLWGALLCGLALMSCGPGSPSEPELRVLAAASCTPLGNAWGAAWPGATDAKVRWQWGASSALARQILDGAPGDVWISAHRRWIETVRAGGALQGEAREVGRGRLVVIAAEPWSAAPTDLADLMQAWPTGARFAIGDPHVPIGQYARQAWNAADLAVETQDAWVAFPDARAVLRAVMSGEAHAGIVYRSDAHSEDWPVLFSIPADHHEPIVYWACVLRQSAQPTAAQSFLEFLTGPEARILRERFAFE